MRVGRSAVTGSLLIVDDNENQLKALCNVLHDQGFVTTGFASPRKALEALAEERFDLLLTDLTMPEMDGITLLRSARELDGDLVGVMMTGNGSIDTAVEAMKVGALDYVIKPFKLNALLPVLTRALTIRQLQRDNAELARRVSDRTAELEIVNKELEAFCYSVAHDLRAPVRAMSGFAGFLLEDHGAALSPEVRQSVLRISRSASQMNQLIEALLRLSRVSRQPLVQDMVDMNALVAGIMEDLKKAAPDRSFAVAIGPLPAVMGDRALLEQVLTNLLSNAVKFTRGRSPAAIAVQAREEERETIFTITDNGTGFNMQYASKLFTVFQRMHSEAEFEGTGVGLSIVQRTIHRHGGRVWAEAEPDKGAAFSFSLPRA
jgi:two-component system, sensor histidine kinase and response regulator